MNFYGEPITEEDARRIRRLSLEHRARQIKALYESARAMLEGGVFYGYPIDVDDPIEVAAALRWWRRDARGGEMSDKVTFESEVKVSNYGGEHWLDVPGHVGVGRYRVTLEPLEPELKPCPFCGGEAELLKDPSVIGGVGWYVKCRKCSAATFENWTKHISIAAWNRRDA